MTAERLSRHVMEHHEEMGNFFSSPFFFGQSQTPLLNCFLKLVFSPKIIPHFVKFLVLYIVMDVEKLFVIVSTSFVSYILCFWYILKHPALFSGEQL